MLNRVNVALALACLALAGTAAPAFASEANPDLEEVAIGTFLVALGLMLVLLIAYAIKHLLGLDRMPPPEPDGGDHGGHH